MKNDTTDGRNDIPLPFCSVYACMATVSHSPGFDLDPRVLSRTQWHSPRDICTCWARWMSMSTSSRLEGNTYSYFPQGIGTVPQCTLEPVEKRPGMLASGQLQPYKGIGKTHGTNQHDNCWVTNCHRHSARRLWRLCDIQTRARTPCVPTTFATTTNSH